MSSQSENSKHEGKFDLQEMLEQLKKHPSDGGSGEKVVSQSDINDMFKKKKKGADK